MSLGGAHLGVPLSAPAPPSLSEAGEVGYEWRRCSFYTTIVSADGAAHLWPLDDASGSAADVVGSSPGHYLGAHASAPGGPLVEQGGVGAAFDGSTSAVRLPGAAEPQGVGAYTYELWARPTEIDGVYRFLVSDEETVAGKREGTGIWLSKAGLGFERWSDGVSTSIDYAPGLPLGVWSQVVASYDGSTMTLFVNGTQVGSGATTALLSVAAGATVVGAGAGARAGFFAGDLADVGLYPKALARAHAAAHYGDATHAPCAPIAGARSASYTPALGDLGDTLSATVTVTGAAHSASVTGQSAGPVDDGHGNVAAASIDGLGEGETVGGNVVVGATLYGLPADRIEFDVDGQYRYSKPAEVPYQYTWYTAAESNGPHTVSVKLWGPGASTPVSTQVTVDVHNLATHPTPLPLGEESMYAELNEGEEATARDLLENVWPARGYPLPHLEWPLTWQEDPYHEAYWEFYFYGLRPEATLLYEWESTGRPAYLEKLIAILRSYVAYDAVRPENTTTFDNDHTSAYRTMELINFYVKLKIAHALPADLEADLARSLEKLGAFLAEAGHFEADYNHGFNEGAALLLLADNFPHMPGAAPGGCSRSNACRRCSPTRSTPTASRSRTRPSTSTCSGSLPDPVGQALRAHARALPEAATKMLVHRRRHRAQRLPADAGATATTTCPARTPTSTGRWGRRPRIRLRLHPRRARDPAPRWHGALPGLRSLPDALAARVGSNRPTRPSRPSTRVPTAPVTPTSTRWGSRCTRTARRCSPHQGSTPTPKNRASSTSTARARTTRWWWTARTRNRAPRWRAATAPPQARRGRAG